jgi:hypothetical protein
LLNLDSLGFVSIASGMYSSTSTASILDGEEFDFLVTTDSIIEINNILYKPIDGMTRLIAIDSNNLTSSALSSITANRVDSTNMNVFVTNNNITDSLDLFHFVQTTTYGYNDHSTPDANLRKMFGPSSTPIDVNGGDSYDVYGNCIHYTHHYNQVTTHFFWIATGTHYDYQGTTVTPGTNC